MVEIGGKEVKSIVLQDGGVLYEKKNINREPIILKFTGTEFSSNAGNPFIGENILIDWGDGTVTEYTTGDAFEHTYATNTEHTITIKNVTEVNNNTFYGTDLTDVFVSSNVVSLGRGCFGSCKSLESVTLSEGLTTIGFACFSVCDSLTEITIPSSVTSIGDNCFANTPLDNINFLWDTSENIISYDSNVYVYLITDYTFTIPEGTTQLYVDKGYPLAKLVEGATSITLTSDKDIVRIGETAIITGTLNYPSQDKIVAFNTKTPESVTITPGDNYYSIGENGFDITDFSNDFTLYSKPINEEEYFIISYLDGVFSIRYRPSIPNLSPKKRFPIKLHVDKNDIIFYYYKNYTDYENQSPISFVIVSKRGGFNEVQEGLKEGKWKLSATNSLTITKNTGLYALTDSNGQATMEYNGIGAGDIIIKGTYIDKNISNNITIQDLNTPALYLNSDKESIIKGETTLLTTSFSIPQENETIYLNKIIDDENLNLELTSTQDGLNHIIKAKVTDENDNGLGNINIKLFKEE